MKATFNRALTCICAMWAAICFVSAQEASAQDLDVLIRSAEEGDAESQNRLAYRYYDGNGVEKDYAEAFKWWLKAAGQNHLIAQYNVALSYEKGEGIEQDYTKAIDLYKKAADKGLAAAQHALGLLFIYGRGVEKNAELAESWLKKAADQNYVHSLYYLGGCYYDKEKYQEALEVWTRSADQGVPEAKYQLGLMYEKGLGTEKDLVKAYGWYLSASKDGPIDAQYRTALCYYFGKGVKQDFDIAEIWFRNLAEKGHLLSQHYLGNCLYYQGKYAECLEWWEKAGNRGIAESSYNVGLCYETGEGCEKDMEKAWQWYLKAAGQGHQESKEIIRALGL